MTSPQSPSGEPSADGSDRLDSWKEIASYLRRDVRTVHRWEAAERLPVHRHAHGERCSVYAFKSELEAWRASRRREGPACTPRSPIRRLAGCLAAAAIAGVAVVVYSRSQLSGGSTVPRSGSGHAPTQVEAPDRGPVEPLAGGGQTSLAYQRGRYILDRRMGAAKALPYLERAAAADNGSAPAQAALAEAHLRIALSGPRRRAESFARAEAAARQSLRLDHRLPAAHAMLGAVSMFRDWDWEGAKVELERAVQLDPGDANVRSWYAMYLRAVARTEEAITQRRLARDAGPLRVERVTWLGNEYLFARRYQDAVREFRAALELEPGYVHALDGLADALALLGAADAHAARTRLLTAQGELELANAFAEHQRRDGFAAAARWLDTVTLERYRKAADPSPWNLAFIHARLGDTEAAFAHLEDAIRQRDPGLMQVRTDPDVDALRADPRFAAMLGRMRMPPSP